MKLNKGAEKFSGLLDVCNISSTHIWRGGLPSSIPEEIRAAADDFIFLEIQHLCLKQNSTICIKKDIRWEHVDKHIMGQLEAIEQKEISITMESLASIRSMICHAFTHVTIPHCSEEDTNVQVHLTNTAGVDFTYSLPFVNELSAVSVLLRQLIGDSSLLLFDGQAVHDEIKTIHIEVRKHIYKEYSDIYTLDFNMVDKSLRITSNCHQEGRNSHASYRYTDTHMLHKLEQHIVTHIEEDIYDLAPFNLGKTNYFDCDSTRHGIVTMHVTWNHKEPTYYIGNLLSTCVPDWYDNLISVIRYYTNNNIVSEFVHQEGRDYTKDLYTYCLVHIFKIDRSFYYRTDRSDIRVGHIVQVPFGYNNDIRTGRVERISYHKRDDVPYNIYKTKFIIDISDNPIIIYDDEEDMM